MATKNITCLLTKGEHSNLDYRVHRDIAIAYETGSKADPSGEKFDILHITNVPDPHAEFCCDLMEAHVEQDGETTIVVNRRVHYFDIEELPPPLQTTLTDTGQLDATWGLVRRAIRRKDERVTRDDNQATRRTKARELTNADPATPLPPPRIRALVGLGGRIGRTPRGRRNG